MDRKSVLILLGIGILIPLFWLIPKGLKNKQDPLWNQLDNDLISPYQSLEDAIPQLDSLYQRCHFFGGPFPDSTAYKIMANPFLPTMEFQKFKFYVDALKDNKFLLISGVSGSGTSTLTDRLAYFIASQPENVMKIYCAPQFDLEFHKQYIGERVNGKFQKGELLKFFEECKSKPKERFVLLIDNLDKINPETFFGPRLWNKLDDPTFPLAYDGIPIEIPKNFHLLSVTKAGISSRIELNNEHFRRLGNRNYLAPDRVELIIYLRNELAKKKEAIKANVMRKKDYDRLQAEIEALEDPERIKAFVYSFEKTNQYIEENFSKNHRLGQWSNLRTFYVQEDQEKLFGGFIEHVNALKPDRVLRREDLDHIHYALTTNGLMKASNFFARQWRAMEEKGFLTEFIVGFTFILFSALFSFFLFRRRQKYIKNYTNQVYKLIEAFENDTISYEEISKRFSKLKMEVDELILNKQIKYSEASFFYTFIETKVKQIEISKEVNRNFRDLVDAFIEDEVLTQKEYHKLKSFLSKIKNKISLQDYNQFSKEIEGLNKRFGSNPEITD